MGWWSCYEWVVVSVHAKDAAEVVIVNILPSSYLSHIAHHLHQGGVVPLSLQDNSDLPQEAI
jgi:hypothetical protein